MRLEAFNLRMYKPAVLVKLFLKRFLMCGALRSMARAVCSENDSRTSDAVKERGSRRHHPDPALDAASALCWNLQLLTCFDFVRVRNVVRFSDPFVLVCVPVVSLGDL